MHTPKGTPGVVVQSKPPTSKHTSQHLGFYKGERTHGPFDKHRSPHLDIPTVSGLRRTHPFTNTTTRRGQRKTYLSGHTTWLHQVREARDRDIPVHARYHPALLIRPRGNAVLAQVGVGAVGAVGTATPAAAAAAERAKGTEGGAPTARAREQRAKRRSWIAG